MEVRAVDLAEESRAAVVAGMAANVVAAVVAVVSEGTGDHQ